jgi:multidrug resistance efflux pump
VRVREADLAVAEAKLTARQLKIARFEKLAADRAIETSVLEEAIAEMKVAVAEVKQAQAALASAQANLNQARKQEPAAKADRKEVALADAETQLERMLKLQAVGAVSEADVDQARIVMAEARIVRELRTIVGLRQKEVDRAKKLLETKAITAEDHQKALDALEAAKRRLAEWK